MFPKRCPFTTTACVWLMAAFCLPRGLAEGSPTEPDYRTTRSVPETRETGQSRVSVEWLASLPTTREMVAREGSSVLFSCNMTGDPSIAQWYNPKGLLLEREPAGGKWLIEAEGVLNITSVSFEDRGRYSRVSPGPSSPSACSVRLRVSYTSSGLGLHYVTVCLLAFSVTMVLNVTRLCMVSTHLKKTNRAINDFFKMEGAEKLQKALEVAKRIPILTQAKTLELAKVTQELAKVTQCKTIELAKVTQFKTKEFGRHMEELARSVPLPPSILTCRTMVGGAMAVPVLEGGGQDVSTQDITVSVHPLVEGSVRGEEAGEEKQGEAGVERAETQEEGERQQQEEEKLKEEEEEELKEEKVEELREEKEEEELKEEEMVFDPMLGPPDSEGDLTHRQTDMLTDGQKPCY